MTSRGELVNQFTGWCIVSPKGRLVSDGKDQDYVFGRLIDAKKHLSREDREDGFRIAKCMVVPDK